MLLLRVPYGYKAQMHTLAIYGFYVRNDFVEMGSSFFETKEDLLLRGNTVTPFSMRHEYSDSTPGAWLLRLIDLCRRRFVLLYL